MMMNNDIRTYIAVVSSYETYKKYQDEFKQVHKQVDILRPTHNNPADLQDGIETLVKEREQLQIKLGKRSEYFLQHSL